MASDGGQKPATWIRVLEIALMPVVLAIVGFMIQNALQKDELETERLKLAVGILTAENVDPAVLEYAVLLLQHSTPDDIALPDGLADKLRTGTVRLPAAAIEAVAPSVSTRTPAELARLTDVHVFACSPPPGVSGEGLAKLIEAIGSGAFAPRGPDLWGTAADDLRGKTTIFVDRNHPESQKLVELQALIDPVRVAEGLPEMVVRSNPGAPSPWYLSVVVCP